MKLTKSTNVTPNKGQRLTNLIYLSSVLVCMLMPFRFQPLKAQATSTPSISWTSAEQTYINDHPTLKLGVDPDFLPFEFIEQGVYKGLSADYVSLVETRIGIDFQVVPDLTWTQAYYQAIDGDIDVLAALSKTANREEFFLFSNMYYEVRRVIVTRNDNTEIRSITDLYGLTVAVQMGSSHHSYLLDYPEINLSLYNTTSVALAAVADGREIAFVGNLATADYIIKSSGLTNLRFSVLPSDTAVGLHFAVTKDKPVLLSIINKALNSLTDEEKNEINSRWVTVTSSNDYGAVMRLVVTGTIMAAIILFVAGGISWFWIDRLSSEVKVRKKAQLELEKAKLEAEEANAVKSTFMARMSHEIRTPLNAITGMSYLIKKSPNVTVAQRTYAERITQASQTMLTLINDILDYSKIEAAKIELEHVTFSLDQVIHNLMSVTAVKIEDKGLGFRFVKDPSVPVWFKGDPKRLEQVLLNLLSNAVKFTDKGEIVFEVRQTAKEGELHHLSFSIKDSGIGMSKNTLHNLFTPFTQADASINRRFGGSGLGLSIVKNLVELMSGTITVYSKEGEGSTFVVNVTLEADPEKQKSESDEDSANYVKNLRVLVLDKNAANLSMIETYLHSFGIPCELTTNSTTAEAILERANGKLVQPFDLLIVDYETPLENALEFIAALRLNKKLKRLPKTLVLIPIQRSDLFDQLSIYQIDGGLGKPVISSLLFASILEIFVHRALDETETKASLSGPHEAVNKTILVVDDNSTNQLIAKLLLEQSGFSVLTANNGQEAVNLYQKNVALIDLILMDLHMPVLNGYDATSAIKQINPDSIVVAMTAEGTPGVQEQCAKVGMKHYIAKPFEPDKFISTIKDILAASGHTIQFEPAVIDTKKGIRQLGDNADLYRLVINEFYKENIDTYQAIKTAIEEGRFQEARQMLHKIKGSTATIGATDLYNSIVEFMETILQGDVEKIKLNLQYFLEKFACVMNYLESNYINKEKKNENEN